MPTGRTNHSTLRAVVSCHLLAASPARVQLNPSVPSDPPQLNLPGLLAVFERWTKPPPERALWRELIHLGIGDVQTFTHAGRPVAAGVVHHVALALYMRSDAAGVIDGFSIERIAADCRIGERSVRASLGVLRRFRAVKMDRSRGRRQSAIWLMNLGGLDWPAVRQRVARSYADRPQRLPLDGASPATMTGLSPATMTGPKGYLETRGSDPRQAERRSGKGETVNPALPRDLRAVAHGNGTA